MSEQEEDGLLALQGEEDIQQACDTLLESARRSVRILAPDLDPRILNRSSVSAALAQLVRVSPNTRIRVLFADGSDAIRRGHQLVTCARRFPSYMSLRRLPEEQRKQNGSWVLVDDFALLWRPHLARMENAWINWRALGMAPKLCRDFDDWWQFFRG